MLHVKSTIDMLQRLKTFKASLWFDKVKLPALECAARGWRVIDLDTIKCEVSLSWLGILHFCNRPSIVQVADSLRECDDFRKIALHCFLAGYTC